MSLQPQDSTIRPKTGADYSRLLVARANAELSARREGLRPSHQDIANELGVSRSMVQQVAAGRRTFGKRVFEQLATTSGQSLGAYMRELIQWKARYDEAGPLDISDRDASHATLNADDRQIIGGWRSVLVQAFDLRI